MKKILIVVITIVMIFSITGCSGSKKKEVDSALQGSWYFRSDGVDTYMSFKKGSIELERVWIATYHWSGKYEIKIKDEVIIATPSDGWLDEHTLEYSYNSKSGELTLWLDGSQGRKTS